MSKEKHLPFKQQFNYQNFPFYWVARLEALYNQEMDLTLKKLGMNVSRWRVCLLLLHHEQLSVSEIAAHAFKKVPTITKIVQCMHDEGLVQYHSTNIDGRIKIISLTEKGKVTTNNVLSSTQELFEQAFHNLSEKDIEQLRAITDQLFQNLQLSRQYR